jgi:alpha-beta hydrolase superfamily lysophospholipase
VSTLVCSLFHFTSTDGLRIACARWESRRPPRGIVQIAHGLGEHVGRYVDLIEALVETGIVVYGNDHRGHGTTATSARHFGDFGEGGFNLLVEDMVSLSRIAREENPGRPIVLLGHSMGSFAAQQYILDHSRSIDGLVLSGTGALDALARLAQAARPGDNPMSFLNAPFKPARTPFDWLSRDPAEVDAFRNDPLCFPTLQPTAWASFLEASTQLADPNRLRAVRHTLPILLISGSEDPVGQQLEGVRVLMNRYHRAGVNSIAGRFYPGGRHEMLHEINRDEVQGDLIRWLSPVLCGNR